MEELKNELIKKIKINFMAIFTSMLYTLLKSKFVSSPPRVSTVQWSREHQEYAFWKTADVFQCLYSDCYFHIRRSSRREEFS